MPPPASRPLVAQSFRSRALPVLTPEKPRSTNPSNKVAENLTGRDYVSWSAILTFRTCPRKYKFGYIDGLPEASVSAAACVSRNPCRVNHLTTRWRTFSAGVTRSPPGLRRARRGTSGRTVR